MSESSIDRAVGLPPGPGDAWTVRRPGTAAWRRWIAARRPSGDRWETGLVCTTIVTLLVLALLGSLPLWTRRVSWFMDHASLFLPMKMFYARCLARGEAFDWMPDIFAGFFVTGVGEVGSYHPLHWLLYRWLPLDIAYNLEVALPFLLMPLGCALFLRKYVSPAGAWLGAALLTFSTQFASTIDLPHFMAIFAHIPWMLLLIQTLVDGPAGRTGAGWPAWESPR